MIDDMQGLHSHASDAYRAGKSEGRDDTFRLLQIELVRISVSHEKTGNVEGFKAAQECAKAMFDLKARMSAPKTV